jgi:acyl-CoA thioesterase
MRLAEIVQGLRRDDAGLSAHAPDSWTQGRTLFGGLQAALLVRAMRLQADTDLPLRSLQTTFIGPVPAGELRLEARRLRAGKSALHADAQILSADGELLCTAIAVFGRARESSLNFAPRAPSVPLSAEAARRIPHLEGISPRFTTFVEQRWASGAFPFCGGQEPRTQIWLRYPDEPRLDESLLIALADSIPSPAISVLRKPAPASSLCWTLELLADRWSADASAWWLMDAEASAARDGYVFQTATLYDGSGQAIALSRQSAVVFA